MKALALAMAGCAFAPTLAVGATASSSTFAVGASAEAWCQVGAAGSVAPIVNALANATSTGTDTVRIVDLVDGTTLSTRAASARLTFAAACNYPHRITLRSQNNGLLRDGPNTSTSIASAVPYTATLNWGDQNTELFADALAILNRDSFITTPQARLGNATVDLVITAGATNLGPGQPLGEGNYEDVISIEVGPQ